MLIHDLHDCLTNYSKLLIGKKNLLIEDAILEKKVKLLFLYSFFLEDNDCNIPVNKFVKHEILSLCECKDSFDCNEDRIVVEDWQQDTDTYLTSWIEDLSVCLKIKPIWVADTSICVKTLIWVEDTFKCVKDLIWVEDKIRCLTNLIWVSDVEECVSTIWVADLEYCAQEELDLSCNNC